DNQRPSELPRKADPQPAPVVEQIPRQGRGPLSLPASINPGIDPDKQRSSESPSKPEHTDPVAALKPLLERIQTEGTGVRVVKEGPKWHRVKYTAANVKYDVRKTDSLVSPYVADVTWFGRDFITDGFETEEQAAAAELPKTCKDYKDPPRWWAKLAFLESR